MTVIEADTQVVGGSFEGLNGSDEVITMPRWKLSTHIIDGGSSRTPSFMVPSKWKNQSEPCYTLLCSSDGTGVREVYVRPRGKNGIVFGSPQNPTPVTVAGNEDCYSYLINDGDRRVLQTYTPAEGSTETQRSSEAGQVAASYVLPTLRSIEGV